MGEVRKSLPALYKKYGITDKEPGPPKRKKKQKSWIWGILDRFKRKKRPEEITRPAGVRTPEQIKEWKEIMRETGKEKK